MDLQGNVSLVFRGTEVVTSGSVKSYKDNNGLQG